MAAVLQINQEGLADGDPNYAREDGLASGELVTLKSLSHEQSFEVALLWVGQHPAPDTTSVASLQVAGVDAYSFTPTAGVFGSWRIELVTDRGTPKEDRIELIFAVKQAPDALRIPAANERSDPTANLVRNGSNYVARSSFNAPDGIAGSPFELGTYVSHWRAVADLIYRYNEGGGGGGGGGALPGAVTLYYVDAVASPLVGPSPNISAAGTLLLCVYGSNHLDGMAPPTDLDQPYALRVINVGTQSTTIKHNQSVGDGFFPFFMGSAADKVLAAGATLWAVFDPGYMSIGPNSINGNVARWRVYG